MIIGPAQELHAQALSFLAVMGFKKHSQKSEIALRMHVSMSVGLAMCVDNSISRLQH
jgi:hypothetical protein